MGGLDLLLWSIRLRRLDGARTHLTDSNLADSRPFEHVVNELRLDLELVHWVPLVVRVERSADCFTCSLAVEIVDAQVVAEQARDGSFEDVELRECILGQRNEEVDA